MVQCSYTITYTGILELLVLSVETDSFSVSGRGEVDRCERGRCSDQCQGCSLELRKGEWRRRGGALVWRVLELYTIYKYYLYTALVGPTKELHTSILFASIYTSEGTYTLSRSVPWYSIVYQFLGSDIAPIIPRSLGLTPFLSSELNWSLMLPEVSDATISARKLTVAHDLSCTTPELKIWLI